MLWRGCKDRPLPSRQSLQAPTHSWCQILSWTLDKLPQLLTDIHQHPASPNISRRLNSTKLGMTVSVPKASQRAATAVDILPMCTIVPQDARGIPKTSAQKPDNGRQPFRGVRYKQLQIPLLDARRRSYHIPTHWWPSDCAKCTADIRMPAT